MCKKMKIKFIIFSIILIGSILMIGAVSVQAKAADLNVNNTLVLSNSNAKSVVKDNKSKLVTKRGEQTDAKNKLLPNKGVENEYLVIYIGWLVVLLSLIFFSWPFKLNRHSKKNSRR